MAERLSAQLTLLAFVIGASFGGFFGGIWAGDALVLAILLFLIAWRDGSRPELLPRLKRPALYGAAAALGLTALMLLVPSLRLGFRLLRPRRLLQFGPLLARRFLPKLAVAALVVRPARRGKDILRGLPRPDRGFLVLALLALLVMVLTNLHSVAPALSWRKLLQMASIFLPLLALSCESVKAKAMHPRLFLWLPATIALTALLLGMELRLGGPLLQAMHGLPVYLTAYNRGVSYLVLASLPAMAGLWLTGRKKWLPVFFLVLFLVAGETESRAAKLALILALPVTGLALWRPQVAGWLLAGVVPALLGWSFFARALYHDHRAWVRALPDSWQARIEIWDYLSFRIMEHPWLGWGLGTTHLLNFRQPDGASYVFINAAAPHPHNVVVQLWVELGVPGLCLGLIFAFYTLYSAARLQRRVAAFALGAWTAALALSLCAFDFWTDASWGCLALTGFAFALLDRAAKQRVRPLN